MKLIKTLKLADYLTIANFASGLLSIFFAINSDFTISGVLMIAAFVFDALDGRVARATNKANAFGKELDSLADLTSFGVAPAVFGFCQGLNEPYQIAILVLFSAAGMLRLARFNVLKVKDFIGIPITTNGILFPLMFLLMGPFNWFIIIYLIMGILMISDFRIKKI
ncbi:MAG: CDP-diacylglycerol--serine O-phosphatidyltransferase [Candidatus Nanoarchaeia archaeon]